MFHHIKFKIISGKSKGNKTRTTITKPVKTKNEEKLLS